MKERSDRFTAIENKYAGYSVYDSAGKKIGRVDDLFVDQKYQTEYVRVKIGSPGKSALVSMDTARVNEQRQLIKLSDPRELVEDIPTFGDNEELTPEFEQQVREFFRIPGGSMLAWPSAGWIVPFLLLGLQERDYYGHELTRKVTDLGLGATPTGPVYRALWRMEKEGMVVSEPGGHRLSRRRFSVTEVGEAYLEFWAHSLERYREEIDLFLQLYDRQPVLGSPGRSTTRT